MKARHAAWYGLDGDDSTAGTTRSGVSFKPDSARPTQLFLLALILPLTLFCMSHHSGGNDLDADEGYVWDTDMDVDEATPTEMQAVLVPSADAADAEGSDDSITANASSVSAPCEAMFTVPRTPRTTTAPPSQPQPQQQQHAHPLVLHRFACYSNKLALKYDNDATQYENRKSIKVLLPFPSSTSSAQALFAVRIESAVMVAERRLRWLATMATLQAKLAAMQKQKQQQEEEQEKTTSILLPSPSHFFLTNTIPTFMLLIDDTCPAVCTGQTPPPPPLPPPLPLPLPLPLTAYDRKPTPATPSPSAPASPAAADDKDEVEPHQNEIKPQDPGPIFNVDVNTPAAPSPSSAEDEAEASHRWPTPQQAPSPMLPASTSMFPPPLHAPVPSTQPPTTSSLLIGTAVLPSHSTDTVQPAHDGPRLRIRILGFEINFRLNL